MPDYQEPGFVIWDWARVEELRDRVNLMLPAHKRKELETMRNTT